MQRFGHFIDGAYHPPAGGDWFPTTNPYTGEPWAEIARGDARDVEAAVVSAHEAFLSWRRLTASQRGAHLRRFADAVAEHAAELADIEVRDNGKLMTEVGVQCRLLPGWLHYYAGLADKIEGRLPPHEKPDTVGFVRYEPFGVCAGITPWNSPLLLLVWKLAPALAAGNAFVVKPSEYTSASSLRLAEIAVEAGLPKGLFNVVTGMGPEVGRALVEHPQVRKVAFTGGELGGVAVSQVAAAKLIPVSLELGGKSANVIFDDADLDAAAAGAVSGIFAASGQTCMAGSRLLIQERIHDAVLDRLAAIADAAIHGDPRDPATNISPVATRAQFEKILSYIDVAKGEGARLVAGGGAGEPPAGSGGLFVRPTIFADVTPDMRIAREEVFGPVLAVMRFGDEEEAVRLANGTDYGLAAGVWTRDLNRALRMTERLEAGTVWVNTYRSTSYVMPFGGVKRSGLGRENGIDAVKEYLQEKSVHINLSTAPVANPFVRR